MGQCSSERVLSDTDSDLFDFKAALPHNVVNDALIAADGEGMFFPHTAATEEIKRE